MFVPAHQVKSSFNCVVIGLMLTVTDIATAHHSIFPFDQNIFVELEGVVSEVRWRNPHVRLTMLVQNDSGEEEAWKLEGDSANAAARRGLTPDSISVGDRVRVAGNPSTHGRREILFTNILLPNGEEHRLTERPRPLRWTEEPAAPTAIASDTSLGRSIFRVWSYGAIYQARKPFVYTPVAKASRAAWDPYTDMLALRCIAPGMPNVMRSPYPIEFIDAGDQIRLRIELWDTTRLIDTVAEEITKDAPTSPLGYSLGRWEGNTLVVETARVDSPYLDDAGTPMSGQVRMVERFTVSEDGTRLDSEIIVTDPQNLAEPAIEDAAWKWIEGTEIRPYECAPE